MHFNSNSSFGIDSTSGFSLQRFVPNVNLLAGDGTWNYRDRPVAKMHNGVLYYAYIDADGNQTVASYDPETGDIDSAVIESSDGDAHNNPGFFINGAGHIVVFAYPHNTAYEDEFLRYRMSTDPEDVSEFGPMQTEEATIDNAYVGRSQSVWFNGETAYLQLNLMKEEGGGDRVETLWISEDGGDTWQDQRELWDFGSAGHERMYTTIWGQDEIIYFVINDVDHSNDPSSSSLYYIEYHISDDVFKHPDGSTAFGWPDTPISDTSQLTSIWEFGVEGNNETYAHWSDVKADADGNPYVAFATYPDDVGRGDVEHTGHWAKWDGANWDYHEVADMGYGMEESLHPSGMSIDPRDVTTVYSVVDVGDTTEETQIQKLTTGDSGDTWDAVSVSEVRNRVHFPNVPWGIREDPDPIEVVWLEGQITSWGSYDTEIRMPFPE